MRIVWVDCLCVSSFLRIFCFCWKEECKTQSVYYFECSTLGLFFANMYMRFTKVRFLVADKVVLSEARLANKSVFETIQNYLHEVSDQVVRHGANVRGERFCKKYSLNLAKYREYTKGFFAACFYKPIEMFFSAKVMGYREEQLVFFIHRSPANIMLQPIFAAKQFLFYRKIFPWKRRKLKERKEYAYGNRNNVFYYRNRFGDIFVFCRYSVLNVLKGVLGLVVKPGQVRGQANIAVDLINAKIDLGAANDLYWLKDSGIKCDSIYGIEYVDYDKASIDAIARLGINRIKLVRNPFNMLRFFFFKRKESFQYSFVCPDWFTSLGLLRFLFLLPYYCITWEQTGWLQCEERFYVSRVLFWQTIYRALKIKAVWSMYDMDKDKVVKAQAIELCGGIYMGSHWSHYPLRNLVNVRKCYDVFFVWGDYFSEYLCADYLTRENVIVGYPLDFTFLEAAKLRDNVVGRENDEICIITFCDNAVSNDRIYSWHALLALYEMLIDILQHNENVVVYLKPKRKKTFDQTVSRCPEIMDMIDSERMRVFLPDDADGKLPPVKIGFSSDLMLGLGVSSAADECAFAGTFSVHGDICGVVNDVFSQNNLGTIVFHDLQILRDTIQNYIDGKLCVSKKELRKRYAMLDPYQDGNAYRRTGFFIKTIQEAFDMGLSCTDTIEYAKNRYNTWVSEKYVRMERDFNSACAC